jgi:hypothetical protein
MTGLPFLSNTLIQGDHLFVLHGYLRPDSGEILDTLMRASGLTFASPNAPGTIVGFHSPNGLLGFLRLSPLLWAHGEPSKGFWGQRKTTWTLMRGRVMLDRQSTPLRARPHGPLWDRVFSHHFGVLSSTHDLLDALTLGYPVDLPS